jgi:hypothetical protein
LTIEEVASATLLVPSITSWTRLEPWPRDPTMQRSLQAQIRDAVWMLARQWQMGEFLGDDAGSPVQATLGGELQTVTTYRPGPDPGAMVPVDPKLPLEVHVERESVTLKLRGSVQLGYYFESLVRKAGIAGANTVIAAFRAAFPIAPSAPDPTYAPIDALRFRSLTSGKALDGEALYASAVAVAAGKTPAIPLPPEASDPGMPAVLADLVAYRASLFNEPAHDPAWQPSSIDYDFALGSPAPNNDLLLDAPSFPGGHLDWYSFTLEPGDRGQVATANPAQVTPISFNFFPNHVVFRGMHDPRWWMFEDSVTDFGQLDAQHVDLAKLLVMEFAFVYGNDWFSVPVPTPIGNLSRITTLVVTDNFGLRTFIRPAEQTQVNAGETPWSMYKLSGPGTRSDFIMKAPTLGLVDDADQLEEVSFVRDDVAAMAWAVEHQLQSDLDLPVDAQEAYMQRLKENGPPAAPVATPGGPKIYYTTEIPVPDNWIPMVPVQTAQGALYLRRGTMDVPTASGLLKIVARALILEPGKPYFLADHVVPRSGVKVDRYFRRTRSMDGTTYVWMARRSGPSAGPAWSGLRFDVVRRMEGA